MTNAIEELIQAMNETYDWGTERDFVGYFIETLVEELGWDEDEMIKAILEAKEKAYEP
jgi:hypothetical protein